MANDNTASTIRSSKGLTVAKQVTDLGVIKPEPKPVLPAMYAKQRKDPDYLELDESLIPAINTTPLTPHLLPPVISYEIAAKTAKPYSMRARKLMPLTIPGTLAGVGGFFAITVTLHSYPISLASMVAAVACGAYALKGGSNKEDIRQAVTSWSYWGAERKLRYWLQTQWGITVKKFDIPENTSYIRWLVQDGAAYSIRLQATDGKTYTVERATQHGPVNVMDENMNRLTAPGEQASASPTRVLRATRSTPKPVDPLPKAIRTRITSALQLREKLLGKPNLSIEHRHILDRADNIITEAEQLAATLQELPRSERTTIFAALERSITAAIGDIEQVSKSHLQTSIRQAKVLDLYTQNLPG